MLGRHPGSAYLTASGAVGVASKPKVIYAAHILSGATAGVLVLKNNGSSGTVYINLTGVVNTGQTWNFGEGMFFPTDCYCTVDANTTSVLIAYEEVGS